MDPWALAGYGGETMEPLSVVLVVLSNAITAALGFYFGAKYAKRQK